MFLSDTWCESTVLPTWKSREFTDAILCSRGIVSIVPSKRRDMKSLGSWQVLSKFDTVGGWTLAWGSEVYFLNFLKGWTLTFSHLSLKNCTPETFYSHVSAFQGSSLAPRCCLSFFPFHSESALRRTKVTVLKGLKRVE